MSWADIMRERLGEKIIPYGSESDRICNDLVMSYLRIGEFISKEEG